MRPKGRNSKRALPVFTHRQGSDHNPFYENGIMAEDEAIKPIELWQIAVHLRAATQVTGALRTAISILLKMAAAKPVLEQLQLLADLAADLYDEVGTLYERCEESLRLANNAT